MESQDKYIIKNKEATKKLLINRSVLSEEDERINDSFYLMDNLKKLCKAPWADFTSLMCYWRKLGGCCSCCGKRVTSGNLVFFDYDIEKVQCHDCQDDINKKGEENSSSFSILGFY